MKQWLVDQYGEESPSELGAAIVCEAEIDHAEFAG